MFSFHSCDEVNSSNDENQREDDEGNQTTEILTFSVLLGSVLTVLRSGLELSLVLGLVDVGACVVGSHLMN